MRKAGNLFGTTLRIQFGLLGGEETEAGRIANTSGGVIVSFPGQSGQIAPGFGASACSARKTGLWPRSDEMMTHLSMMGSFLNSGIYRPAPAVSLT